MRFAPEVRCCFLALFLSLLTMGEGRAESISIGNTQGLSFGDFVAGTGGSVSVSAAGARNAGGGVFLIPSSEGIPARFTINGSPHATYTIQLPPDDTVYLTGPGNDMAINDFVSTPSGAGGQLDASGTQTLNVGATLYVGSSQTSGDYSGSFSVIVEYN